MRVEHRVSGVSQSLRQMQSVTAITNTLSLRAQRSNLQALWPLLFPWYEIAAVAGGSLAMTRHDSVALGFRFFPAFSKR